MTRVGSSDLVKHLKDAHCWTQTTSSQVSRNHSLGRIIWVYLELHPSEKVLRGVIVRRATDSIERFTAVLCL